MLYRSHAPGFGCLLCPLSVLVFVAMSAYLLMPAPEDFWKRTTNKEVACAQGRPRLSIFMTSEPEPGRRRSVPGPAEDRSLSPSPSPSPEFGTAQPRDVISLPPESEEPYDPPIDTREAGERAPEDQPPPTERVYVVKKGDTLSEIAARLLGSVRYSKDILERNPKIKNANDLRVGQKLILPLDVSSGDSEEEAETAVAPEPPQQNHEDTNRSAEREPSWREVQVKSGDTLYGLAARYLGDGSQWPRLRAMNKDRVGEDGQLAVGTKLRVPPATEAR